jgi:hypothetical protein
VWSGGGNLAPGPLGSVAGDPPAPGLAPLPLLRTGGCRPGAEAARVPGSKAVAAAPSTSPGMGCNSHPLAKRLQTGKGPSSSHFSQSARSCADSDWRSSVNQGRGSLFRHTGCTTQYIYGLGRPHGAVAAISEVLRDHTARARAATAVPATASVSS